MIERVDVSSLKSMALSILSLMAVLALQAIVTILRRATSGEKVPFHRASIDFGSYRITVSTRQPSNLPKKRGRRMVVRASGYTAVRKAKDASSYSVQNEVPSSGGSDAASKPSRSFDGRQLEPANDD